MVHRKVTSRALFLAASIALIGLFAFPLWRITLQAPQYPDGITMYIWVNKIKGETSSTLQNMNILNHYVGMDSIDPDSFDELRYFPIIITIMIVLGVILAFVGSRRWHIGWLSLLCLLLILGLVDFYLWEYRYGHNLSPNAPIKIPGAVYQPPFIGTKNLLNFVATSLPYTGAIFIGFSLLAAFASFFFPPDRPMSLRRPHRLFALSAILLVLAFFLPLWRISLSVAQYPTLISIHIHMNNIKNASHDKALEIMNVLNHNIGMKAINPKEIPEFQAFPLALWALVALGFFFACTRMKKRGTLIWPLLLVACLCAAFVDYYLWLYEFGHNIDPHAPIQLESGGFHPPLLGEKSIANIRVQSYPHMGAGTLLLSALSAIIGYFYEK